MRFDLKPTRNGGLSAIETDEVIAVEMKRMGTMRVYTNNRSPDGYLYVQRDDKLGEYLMDTGEFVQYTVNTPSRTSVSEVYFRIPDQSVVVKFVYQRLLHIDGAKLVLPKDITGLRMKLFALGIENTYEKDEPL